MNTAVALNCVTLTIPLKNPCVLRTNFLGISREFRLVLPVKTEKTYRHWDRYFQNMTERKAGFKL